MPIVLANPVVMPVITYDTVQMVDLHINQEKTTASRASLVMTLTLYYKDANGEKVFSPLKEHTEKVGFDDADKWIMSLQGVDQAEALASLQAIKGMVATVTRILSPWGAASVV